MKDLDISLVEADLKDCQQILDMQIESFKSLLQKYQDYDTNPAAESLEHIQHRMAQNFTDYYFIHLNDQKIGVIRVVAAENDVFKISPIFILPEFQGKGYAKQAILKMEMRYPNARKWELATIKQEVGLCRFYESLGYKVTGRKTPIKTDMTIIGYSKNL